MGPSPWATTISSHPQSWQEAVSCRKDALRERQRKKKRNFLKIYISKCKKLFSYVPRVYGSYLLLLHPTPASSSGLLAEGSTDPRQRDRLGDSMGRPRKLQLSFSKDKSLPPVLTCELLEQVEGSCWLGPQGSQTPWWSES